MTCREKRRFRPTKKTSLSCGKGKKKGTGNVWWLSSRGDDASGGRGVTGESPSRRGGKAHDKNREGGMKNGEFPGETIGR